VDVETLSQILK